MIKDREARGCAYDGAAASFELLVRRALGQVPDYFELELPGHRRAPLQRAGPAGHHLGGHDQGRGRRPQFYTVAEGNGPVNALDHALRQALAETYPSLEGMQLVDYKVRILAPEHGTAAVTRVIIESGDGEGRSGRPWACRATSSTPPTTRCTTRSPTSCSSTGRELPRRMSDSAGRPGGDPVPHPDGREHRHRRPGDAQLRPHRAAPRGPQCGWPNAKAVVAASGGRGRAEPGGAVPGPSPPPRPTCTTPWRPPPGRASSRSRCATRRRRPPGRVAAPGRPAGRLRVRAGADRAHQRRAAARRRPGLVPGQPGVRLAQPRPGRAPVRLRLVPAAAGPATAEAAAGAQAATSRRDQGRARGPGRPSRARARRGRLLPRRGAPRQPDPGDRGDARAAPVDDGRGPPDARDRQGPDGGRRSRQRLG